MNELKDTIELMNSSDYKDRFKAEYYQLKNQIHQTSCNACEIGGWHT